MDIKNDLIVAYCAGYGAARYDVNEDGLHKDYNDTIKDASNWVKMCFKTGMIGEDNNE